jgi:DNA-directed RNA polymerase I subunit RPA2
MGESGHAHSRTGRITLTCHYLNDGTCTVRFLIRKQEFFLPATLLLKALGDATDLEIYEKVTHGDTNNTFVTERIELNLREFKQFGLDTRLECLAYLGI